MKNILVYKCGPDEYGPKVIENSLESFQKEVNGYVEYFPVGEHDGKELCFVVNEEGRIRGMEPNFSLEGQTFFGPVFVVALKQDEDGDEEETNLSVEDIDWFEEWILKNVKDEDIINEGL